MASLFRFATHMIIVPCFPPSLLIVIYEVKSTFRQYRSNASCIKASYSSKLHFWTLWNVYSGNGSLALCSSVTCARARSASGLTISPGTMDFISVSTSWQHLLPRLSMASFYLIFFKITPLNCHSMFTETHDLRLQYSYRCFNFHEETDCNY